MVPKTNLYKITADILRRRLSIIHGIPEQYNISVNRTKEELLKKINELSEKASQSELARRMKVAKGFYTMEMAPPKNGEIKQIQDDIKLMKDFFQSGAYKYLTVRQAWLLFLVAIEVALWFFLGETVGKMHIVGYKV